MGVTRSQTQLRHALDDVSVCIPVACHCQTLVPRTWRTGGFRGTGRGPESVIPAVGQGLSTGAV